MRRWLFLYLSVCFSFRAFFFYFFTLSGFLSARSPLDLLRGGDLDLLLCNRQRSDGHLRGRVLLLRYQVIDPGVRQARPGGRGPRGRDGPASRSEDEPPRAVLLPESDEYQQRCQGAAPMTTPKPTRPASQ